MSLPTTMRAVQYDKFGGSDLLTINEVPVPSPRPGQVLVRVQAFSVNRIDVIVREGEMRLFTGKRFPKGTGVDALGEVVSVGTGVMDYKVGDIVWGFNGSISMAPTGTAAEYVLFRENRIHHAPRIQNQIDAAALPLVSLAALQVLRKNLKLQRGQRLLVVGATGGVGHAALQIGQILGAQVATVSAEENIALCRELGSIEAYDHEALPDPEKVEKFDAILRRRCDRVLPQLLEAGRAHDDGLARRSSGGADLAVHEPSRGFPAGDQGIVRGHEVDYQCRRAWSAAPDH